MRFLVKSLWLSAAMVFGIMPTHARTGPVKLIASYNLLGEISGFTTNGRRCYIAVDDPNSTYSNAWHFVPSPDICLTAQIIYASGQSATVKVMVDEKDSFSNDVIDIETVNQDIKWAPYFD